MKPLLFSFLLVTLLFSGNASPAETGASYLFNWLSGTLEITSSSYAQAADAGNAIEWQYGMHLRARNGIAQSFIASMEQLRADAYHTARSVLLADPGKNEKLYGYIMNFKRYTSVYSDNSVTLKSYIPLYGEEGFAHLIVSAGTDTGSFQSYDTYVYSVPFSGLVVDARGLARVPALAPRIFDEQQRVIYSAALVKSDFFKKWGAVLYTNDPYYRGHEKRVGKNPLKAVALPNPKLIETDICIDTGDAIRLMQHTETKKSLEEGRVIIILDSEALKQRPLAVRPLAVRPFAVK